MVQKPPAFDLTEHATKARAIRNLGHAVGDHRDRCPCPDHHCRRLVHDSMSYWAIVQTKRTSGGHGRLPICGVSAMKWTDRIGRRLKLNDLHILMTVAESGSMGKAAKALGIINFP